MNNNPVAKSDEIKNKNRFIKKFSIIPLNKEI